MKKMSVFVFCMLLGSFSYGGEFTYDFSVSGGQSGGDSYTEAQLGLNYFAQKWLAWRNALFARFPSIGSSSYGLDSSGRSYWTVDFSERSFLVSFLGSGIRFSSLGENHVFLEGGFTLHLASLTLGIGAKGFLGTDDVQYFLVLAGGGKF
ncbi:MAG: hypothetical protein D6797_07690 [Bdellovibrio sp.]|nr:MAG: hypothetical protein D6797_07690 [Bdellovibrio sp.]